MALSSQTKTLLVVAALLALVYFLYKRNSLPIHNSGSVEMMEQIPRQMNLPANMEEGEMEDDEEGEGEGEDEGEDEEQASHQVPMMAPGRGPQQVATVVPAPTSNGQMGDYNNIPVPREDMIRYFPQRDYAPPESDWLSQKFNSRNKARRGFKRSSYIGAKRGSLGPSEWDDYFDHNNNVIGNSQTGDNDKFLPIDESNGGFAVFKSKGRAPCGSNQNCEPEDLFDVDKYLPQEVNDDWFEVQPEPISVKNRHLINITKPIGVNTIGTSLRNASWDIRGAPANPKMVVSPWLQSSIEPDTNLKPLL